MFNYNTGDMKEVRQIDLHLPRGWNDCTTRELEQISAAMMLRQQQATRLRPFDWAKVKVDVVLAVNNLDVRGQVPGSNNLAGTEPARDLSPDIPYLVQFRHRKFFRRPAPFPITTGQMMDLCSRLDWIDAPTAQQQPLYHFPYPVLRLSWLHEYHGPGTLLDSYTWTEYRLLQDWMGVYMQWQNRLITLQHDLHATSEQYLDVDRQMDSARAHFLAVLFRAKRVLSHPDSAARAFRDFDPVRWQVILLWWSSLMQQLMKKFPRVFKPQPVGRGRKQQKHQSPWDFYNHVTATLADEYKISETEQKSETYSVTLQKLENMARKSEELERLSKKK